MKHGRRVGRQINQIEGVVETWCTTTELTRFGRLAISAETPLRTIGSTPTPPPTASPLGASATLAPPTIVAPFTAKLLVKSTVPQYCRMEKVSEMMVPGQPASWALRVALMIRRDSTGKSRDGIATHGVPGVDSAMTIVRENDLIPFEGTTRTLNQLTRAIRNTSPDLHSANSP